MKMLQQKTALVTGGGRGIGLSCATHLAELGANLVLCDKPGRDELDAAAEQVRASGVDCVTIQADVFQRASCESLVSQAVETLQGIDILVSVPAFSRRDDFLDYDPRNFEKTLQGTLASAFHMGQLVARHMVHRGRGGKMVFISSVHGQIPYARAVAYNAAKAGLDHMVRTMAVELVSHRINVNAIAPGWIDTPGEREIFSAEVIERESRRLPWGRMGRPSEIAASTAFLCSSDADYITGVVLPVDGGYRFKDCVANHVPEEL